uniref:Retrovirus-related Pol polyprotein from transposon TNT 1-94-like beta-barrel domain-containing protein n=1 Tax=Brassica oleracea TaxID=3712 RepID=A0A3P6F0F4_BRAOL|nr:unnamed protein product [Brassica oleracea]
MATANEPTPQEVVFDDLNYEAWAPIMKATLVERGLWDVVENVAPPNPLRMPELAATIQAEDLSPWRDFVVKDTKAIHILQCSVPDSVFRQTLDAASAKDLWDLLQESNEQAKEGMERLLPEYQTLAFDIGPRTYDDDIIMSEGIGDVVMVTYKGKKKMIKNVFFVPKIDRNILTAGQNEGLWDVVENGVLPHPSRDPDPAATLDFDELCRWRDLVRQDMKALEILQSSLTDSIFKKTFSATSAKELWEMLEQAPDVSFDADMWMVYIHQHHQPYDSQREVFHYAG